MPSPDARPEGGPPDILRCNRCGTVVEGTQHTRSGYRVGHYRLHTGPTEEVTIRQPDDTLLPYRRLVRPVEVVSCPRCFAEPAVRRLWDSFGDTEEGLE
jgi:hypothetical protein